MRRGTKSLILSFSVLILFFALAGFALHSPRLPKYLLAGLKKGTGWEISLQDSRISLLRGLVIARGVEVRDPQGRSHVTAERVLINLSSLSLVRGKIIVTTLEVDRPLINIEKTAPVGTPMPDLLKLLFEKMEGSLWLQSLIFDRVVVHDFFLIRPGGKTLSLKESRFRIASNLFREIEIAASIEGASGLLPTLRSLELDFVLKREGLRLKKADVRLEKIRLLVSGEGLGTSEKGHVALKGSLEAPTVLSDLLHFNCDADLRQKTATLKIEAHLGKAVFGGTGSLELPRLLYRLSFTARDLPLEALFRKMSGPILPPSRGLAEVQGTASGQLPAIKVESRATIREFRHGPLAARKADGTITFNWPNLNFEAFVRPGTDEGVQAVVRGGVSFTRKSNSKKLEVVPRKVDLKFENASLPDIVPTLKVMGKLDGHLNLVGAEGASVKGSGQAQVTKGRWFYGPIDSLTTHVDIQPPGKIIFSETSIHIPALAPLHWPGSIKLDTFGESVAFEGQPVSGITLKGSHHKETKVFRIDSLKVQRDGGSLQGSFRLTPGGQAETRLKGDLNLEWLSLLPTIFREARGMARADLRGSGLLKDPRIQGRLEFLGNEVGIRGFYREVTDLKGSLAIDGDHLSPELSGRLGDGSFRLNGSLRLSRWKPEEFDLKFQGANMTLSRPNIYRIDLDTDLSLQGRMPSPLLTGRVDIVDGRYEKNFVIRDLVLKPFVEELSEPSLLEKILPDLRLALTVKNSGDLRIRNYVADIDLRSDLQIGGTQSRPVVRGDLQITEGIFHYLGEDFILTEGQLEFLPSGRREPYLNLVAEQHIPPDSIVQIAVKGYVSNLAVDLSSSPALPREDIISLISSGMTYDEIREAGRSRRSVGANILGSEIAGLLERPVAKKIHLDILRLEASESGKLSRVSVGKNVTDRLSLELLSDFDPETPERVFQANYYLTDNILLKGFRSWTRTGGETVPRFQFDVSFRFRLY